MKSYPHEDLKNFLNQIHVHKRFRTFEKIKASYILNQAATPTIAPNRLLFTPKMNIEIPAMNAGEDMDDLNDLMHTTTEQVKESLDVLKDLSNQVSAITAVVQPKLQNQIREIRESRMALVNELRQCLTMLQDVRKFFIESDYEKEMERMERFIRACKEIKTLKEDGTFDAICDAAIRLAVREEKK